MDRDRAAAVVAALAGAVPDDVLLWRGEGLDGHDIDLVVLGNHAAPVSRVLRVCGLTPSPQEPGRVLWRLLPDEAVVVDVFAGHTWPSMYPALPEVAARAVPGTLGLLVASAGDRMLMHTAEALAGWPPTKTLAKLEAAALEPGAADSLSIISRRDPGLAVLASIAERPGLLLGNRAKGWLRLRTAARAAARSPQARAAVRSRMLGEPRSRSPVVGARPERAVLIALSGMDGAGKSTASLALLDGFDERGEAAIVHWTRLARDLGLLGRLARPVRSSLRRTGSVATIGAPARTSEEPGAVTRSRRSRTIDAAWVVAVAASSVGAARRAERIRRGGTHVICDRWLLDALVDLRIRYGHQPLAEWVLRHGFPTPDVAALLHLDSRLAAARKPGDQPEAVLDAMSANYDQLAGSAGVQVLDASRPSAEIVDDLRRLLRERSGEHGRPVET